MQEKCESYGRVVRKGMQRSRRSENDSQVVYLGLASKFLRRILASASRARASS